jgi:hypothetical protein
MLTVVTLDIEMLNVDMQTCVLVIVMLHVIMLIEGRIYLLLSLMSFG